MEGSWFKTTLSDDKHVCREEQYFEIANGLIVFSLVRWYCILNGSVLSLVGWFCVILSWICTGLIALRTQCLDGTAFFMYKRLAYMYCILNG